MSSHPPILHVTEKRQLKVQLRRATVGGTLGDMWRGDSTSTSATPAVPSVSQATSTDELEAAFPSQAGPSAEAGVSGSAYFAAESAAAGSATEPASGSSAGVTREDGGSARPSVEGGEAGEQARRRDEEGETLGEAGRRAVAEVRALFTRMESDGRHNLEEVGEQLVKMITAAVGAAEEGAAAAGGGGRRGRGGRDRKAGEGENQEEEEEEEGVVDDFLLLPALLPGSVDVLSEEEQRSLESINGLLAEMQAERERMARTLKEEAATSAELRAANEELSHKLASQTQHMELLVAQTVMAAASSASRSASGALNARMPRASFSSSSAAAAAASAAIAPAPAASASSAPINPGNQSSGAAASAAAGDGATTDAAAAAAVAATTGTGAGSGAGPPLLPPSSIPPAFLSPTAKSHSAPLLSQANGQVSPAAAAAATALLAGAGRLSEGGGAGAGGVGSPRAGGGVGSPRTPGASGYTEFNDYLDEGDEHSTRSSSYIVCPPFHSTSRVCPFHSLPSPQSQLPHLSALAVNRQRMSHGRLDNESVESGTKHPVVIQTVNEHDVFLRLGRRDAVHHALVQVRRAHVPSLARERDVVRIVHLW
ncbi:unnamed protein product [Closterium sp. NIES-54]